MSVDGDRTTIFFRDLALDIGIGVNTDEHGRLQRVIVHFEASIQAPESFAADQLEDTVSYDTIVRGTRAIAAKGHIGLVETLAEHIAALALEDPRVIDVVVEIEKLGVYGDATKVGARLYRKRGA